MNVEKIENRKLKIMEHPGFTLIELLVVIAIVGILTATVLVNMGKNDDRDVRMEAGRLTTFLRDAQNKALAAEKVSGATTGKICGFGVHENSNSELWVYYVETSGSSPLDVDCSGESNIFTGNSDAYKYDIFDFQNGVTINTFNDLFFLSPNGEVYANGSNNPASFPVTITLNKGATSINNIVQIDQSGRIY